VKAFLGVAGAVFALVVLAHAARIAVEPRMARDPWFWFSTAVAAALAVWAWRLFGKLRRA
jgi:hypothetical protein